MKTMTRETERTERMARCGYTHMLHYIAVRDCGDIFEDSLPWCSEESANEWVAKINAKWEAGKINYRVTLSYVRDIRGLA